MPLAKLSSRHAITIRLQGASSVWQRHLLQIVRPGRGEEGWRSEMVRFGIQIGKAMIAQPSSRQDQECQSGIAPAVRPLKGMERQRA